MCITRLFASKEYIFFEEVARKEADRKVEKELILNRRVLNCFQRFLRAVFGAYGNTHLNTVVTGAYRYSLTSTLFSPYEHGKNVQNLLHLIKKSKNYSVTLFPNTNVQKSPLQIKIQYDIETLQEQGSPRRYAISSIGFFIKSGKAENVHKIITLFKNNQGNVFVKSREHSIAARFPLDIDDENLHLETQNFIRKIIQDSSPRGTPFMVYYTSLDHTWNNRQHMEGADAEAADRKNIAQQSILTDHGWRVGIPVVREDAGTIREKRMCFAIHHPTTLASAIQRKASELTAFPTSLNFQNVVSLLQPQDRGF
ncbi:MAG: hypothetical protein H0X51_09585 [Parachlamydiaceae bacterium]|nr:hypothetical protein [Parachlamydiaceae bacterium]